MTTAMLGRAGAERQPTPAGRRQPHRAVPHPDGLVQAVTDLSYTVERARPWASSVSPGSGKSSSSMAVLGLHDPRAPASRARSGSAGEEVIGADQDTLRRLRGNDVAMIFQDPLAPCTRSRGSASSSPRPPGPPHAPPSRGAATRDPDARPGRHPAADHRVNDYPAPVLGRHAPARDDRHGAGERPVAADRRRADHRARRDRAGPDPRPAPGPAAGSSAPGSS